MKCLVQYLKTTGSVLILKRVVQWSGVSGVFQQFVVNKGQNTFSVCKSVRLKV